MERINNKKCNELNIYFQILVFLPVLKSNDNAMDTFIEECQL
jgi:hypothetical protein